MIHRGQHLGVDLVALGQRFVEVHRTDRGTDVGHHQVEDGQFELGDLVGRLGGVQHLEIDHAVHLDHGVVLGDHVLAGDVHHLFHHVDLAAHAVEDWDQEMQARGEGADVFSEAFDRPFIPLRHHPHGLEENDDADDDEHKTDERTHVEPSPCWNGISIGPAAGRTHAAGNPSADCEQPGCDGFGRWRIQTMT